MKLFEWKYFGSPSAKSPEVARIEYANLEVTPRNWNNHISG